MYQYLKFLIVYRFHFLGYQLLMSLLLDWKIGQGSRHEHSYKKMITLLCKAVYDSHFYTGSIDKAAKVCVFCLIFVGTLFLQRIQWLMFSDFPVTFPAKQVVSLVRSTTRCKACNEYYNLVYSHFKNRLILNEK